METIEMLSWVALLLAVCGALLVIGGVVSLLRARPLRFVAGTLTGLLLVAMGALLATVSFGVHGYRALTREETAAMVVVRPLAPQRFMAEIRFPDGRTETVELAGDALYVDAHILKWKPAAQWMGLHTAYELDRISGRYHALADERAAPRTVHSLAADRAVDLFSLRRRYTLLAPLVDAEYGSASFVPVERAATLEVRVSPSGLLIRERP